MASYLLDILLVFSSVTKPFFLPPYLSPFLPPSRLQLGLLLACDWLLGLRTMLWEEHAKEEGVKEENCTGFYQDLDTLSKLVTLLPPAISRVSHVIIM